jgi:outer membrane protein assembly factor BamB
MGSLVGAVRPTAGAGPACRPWGDVSGIFVVWLAAVLLALSGCGGSDAVKPAELTKFKPKANARVAWSTSVGESTPYVLSPALHRGSIYAASHSGELVRLDVAKGKRVWRVDTKAQLSGGVGAEEGMVVVGSDKGAVLAYSLEGKPLWRAQVTSEILSVPRVSGGLVLVRSGDGRIFGLDAANGQRKWEYQTTLPPLLLRCESGLSLTRNLVLAGLQGGRIVALNAATGTLAWDVVVAQPKGANELERITDVAASPLLDDEQACAVAYQGRIACFDLAKGALVWGRDASSASALASDALTLYMTEESSVVQAFDKSSGATLWKQDKLLARQVSAPVVAGSHLVVGDFEGYVHVLDREDGSFAARVSTDGTPILARPLLVGRDVLVQTAGGGLFAISINPLK